MNIHTTKSYSYTTTADTAEGTTVDLEALAGETQVLESQCTVLGAAPQGVSLRVLGTPTHAQVLVEGGALPAGTVLTGVLSIISARP